MTVGFLTSYVIEPQNQLSTEARGQGNFFSLSSLKYSRHGELSSRLVLIGVDVVDRRTDWFLYPIVTNYHIYWTITLLGAIYTPTGKE